jgi:hypothetical protein
LYVKVNVTVPLNLDSKKVWLARLDDKLEDYTHAFKNKIKSPGIIRSKLNTICIVGGKS